MSITLAVPPAIVQEARALADRSGTTINQYIRDCLELKANEEREYRLYKAREFERFAKSLGTSGVGADWKFSREEATAR